MGTNYYRVKKLDSFSKELAIKYIEIGKILGENSLESLIQDFKEEIHICKCSYGWLTLFDYNKGLYYKKNKEDLTRFLSEDGFEIKDEYGKTYSIKEFWEKIEDHDSKMKQKGFSDLIGSDAVLSDNLRWSLFTDFS